ncbi:hypothetical protein [Virgisporangium aliadipatigenens]|uniref:hypothetical protein n=1 Tax=Virgisporangium aliadipatigenens TaxID=741659 RepID=UPI001944047F|nr:hypothetical protein [Virgisporangium aliadipatigenens]
MSEVIDHPVWCDVSECVAFDPWSRHRSAPFRIDKSAPGGVAVIARLTSTSTDPTDSAEVVVELTLVHSHFLGGQPAVVEGHLLDRRTVRELHALLGRLLPMMATPATELRSATA